MEFVSLYTTWEGIPASLGLPPSDLVYRDLVHQLAAQRVPGASCDARYLRGGAHTLSSKPWSRRTTKAIPTIRELPLSIQGIKI